MTARVPPAAVVACVLLVAALGAAACGGSSSSGERAAAAGGFTPREVAVRRCLHREGLLPLGAASRPRATHTIAWDIRHRRNLPAALSACGLGAGHGPSFIEVVLPRRELMRYLDAWTGCLGRHGERTPPPDTSGVGPIFPAAVAHSARYRAAATHCIAIERQEIDAMRTAGRL